MLRQRIIPSLLLRGGRLVKGVRYDALRDAGQPNTTVRAHNAQGADEIFVLDIEASRATRPPDVAAIRSVAVESFMPVTAGGGIASIKDARDVMNAGADKICVTTTAMDNPDLITELAHLYGSQAVVVGIDVVGENGHRALYDHRTKSDARRDWREWIVEAVERGAGEVRLMAVDREGTREGFDLDLFHAARHLVDVPLVLEGGAGTLEHVEEALAAGADGVALGTLLVFSDNNLVKIGLYLAERGRNVRT